MAACLLAAAVLVGCAGDLEQAMVGQWKADDSASGMAMRAAKLKSQSPDAEGSDIMAAARAIGNIGLDLRADKSFDLAIGGNVIQGTWSFDNDREEVELDAQTAEVAPENAEKNPGPFKPAKYVAYSDDMGNLRLYMMPRESYDTIKEMGKTGNVGFVLYKQ